MQSNFGRVVLCLAGVLLALTAVGVGESQAANVTSPLSVGFNAEVEKALVLLSTSGGNAVAISCGKAEVTEATLEAEGKGIGSGNFSECTTSINGAASSGCVPQSQPIPFAGSSEIVKHEGVTYLKATGTSGTFLTFKFKCAALPITVKVTGTAWIKDAAGEWEVEKVTHLIEEGTVPAKALGGLFFGANSAAVDGSLNISFSDAEHKGKAFSALAAGEAKGAAWMVGI